MPGLTIPNTGIFLVNDNNNHNNLILATLVIGQDKESNV